ncbi:14252_t:CDS:2, partial [Funneliformis caledonium]
MELWLGRHISYYTIWRAIRRLGYTHKQLSKPAIERNENDRLNFIVHMSQYSSIQLVFLMSLQGALCLNGLLAYAIQEGPMNSNDYSYFIKHVLLSKINTYPGPYSVLILVNVSIHKGQHLLDICNAKGVQIECLPPYSPELNP